MKSFILYILLAFAFLNSKAQSGTHEIVAGSPVLIDFNQISDYSTGKYCVYNTIVKFTFSEKPSHSIGYVTIKRASDIFEGPSNKLFGRSVLVRVNNISTSINGSNIGYWLGEMRLDNIDENAIGNFSFPTDNSEYPFTVYINASFGCKSHGEYEAISDAATGYYYMDCYMYIAEGE